MRPKTLGEAKWVAWCAMRAKQYAEKADELHQRHRYHGIKSLMEITYLRGMQKAAESIFEILKEEVP
jgi:hypothetical protein